MADLSSYFSNLKKYSEENSGSNSFNKTERDDSGKVLNLTKQSNYGTVLLRPINDVNGIPMKVLSKIYELYESSPAIDEEGKPILNNDGTQRYQYNNCIIADPVNYSMAGITLTPEQTMALNNCISAIKKYEDYVYNEVIDPEETATGLNVKFRKEISMFWAKVLSLTSNNQTSLTEGKVRLIRHNSSNFSRQFIQALDDGTAIRKDGGAWIQQYFSRTVGASNKIVSITTDLNKGGTVGYSMSYMFAEGAQYELTQADVDLCTSLHTQICDLTNLDVSVLNAITNRINGYIIAADRKMGNATGAQQAAQPAYTTIDPSQVVQAQPTVTGVVPPTQEAPQVNTIPTGTPVVNTIPNAGATVTPSATPNFNTMNPVANAAPVNPDPIGQMPLPPGVNL